MEKDPARSLGWIGGLDGLRAIAVLSVVAFHLETKRWVPGGFIGVDLFFVLSGFLITALLISEYDRTGRIDLRGFYLRRMRRLLPALVLTLVIVSLIGLVVLDPSSRNHPSPELYARSVIGALLYGFNWIVALGASYMHSLIHLWSLSIEEQFYVLWPALLAWMLRGGTTRGRIQCVLMVLIALSISVQFAFLDWGWKRLYYGSDYRAHALLAGCMLAIMWSDSDLRERAASWKLRGPLAVVSVMILGLIAGSAKLETAEMYMGGFPLVVLSSVAVIYWTLASSSDSWPRLVLDSRALVWIGKRSYGIYLFHMPFVIWTREFELSLIEQMIFVGGATFLATTYSYRLVERPIVEGKGPELQRPPWLERRKDAAA